MNKIYILFLCLCYAVSAIMANTYKNDKEVTSPTDANIFGHVVDKATGDNCGNNDHPERNDDRFRDR